VIFQISIKWLIDQNSNRFIPNHVIMLTIGSTRRYESREPQLEEIVLTAYQRTTDRKCDRKIF
jgi:hypothetical protein